MAIAMALPVETPALAATVCLDPSGNIKPLPVVVILMLPVTSNEVPAVTVDVLIPTLVVVIVIAPRVDALPTIVMFDAVTAPVTVKPPVTVAPVEVNATAPIVEAEPTTVMLEAVTAPVTVNPPVIVAEVDVNATAPIVDADPVAVISETVIVLALMLPSTVRLLAVTDPVTVRLPVTVAAVDVNATAPIDDALPVAVMFVTVIVSAEMLPLTVNVDAVTSVKLAFCDNRANVPLVAGRVTVMLPL